MCHYYVELAKQRIFQPWDTMGFSTEIALIQLIIVNIRLTVRFIIFGASKSSRGIPDIEKHIIPMTNHGILVFESQTQ